MNTYKEGTTVRISAEFRVNSVLTSPTTLELIINGSTFPDNNTSKLTEADVVNDSIGKYHYDVVDTKPGKHSYYWRGYGSVIAFDGDYFFVQGFKMEL